MSDSLDNRLYLALGQIRLGHLDRAKEVAHFITRNAYSQPALLCRTAEAVALCGEKASATRFGSAWKLLSPHSPVSLFRQALLLLSLDDPGAAISKLSIALEEREAELIWLATDPGFDPIRRDPEYLRMVGRVFPPS